MRKAVRDVEIKGYLIPKGWCVFTYFRSVHLDQAHFDEPYKFNPWRWKVTWLYCHTKTEVENLLTIDTFVG